MSFGKKKQSGFIDIASIITIGFLLGSLALVTTRVVQQNPINLPGQAAYGTGEFCCGNPVNKCFKFSEERRTCNTIISDYNRQNNPPPQVTAPPQQPQQAAEQQQPQPQQSNICAAGSAGGCEGVAYGGVSREGNGALCCYVNDRSRNLCGRNFCTQGGLQTPIPTSLPVLPTSTQIAQDTSCSRPGVYECRNNVFYWCVDGNWVNWGTCPTPTPTRAPTRAPINPHSDFYMTATQIARMATPTPYCSQDKRNECLRYGLTCINSSQGGYCGNTAQFAPTATAIVGQNLTRTPTTRATITLPPTPSPTNTPTPSSTPSPTRTPTPRPTNTPTPSSTPTPTATRTPTTTPSPRPTASPMPTQFMWQNNCPVTTRQAIISAGDGGVCSSAGNYNCCSNCPNGRSYDDGGGFRRCGVAPELLCANGLLTVSRRLCETNGGSISQMFTEDRVCCTSPRPTATPLPITRIPVPNTPRPTTPDPSRTLILQPTQPRIGPTVISVPSFRPSPAPPTPTTQIINRGTTPIQNPNPRLIEYFLNFINSLTQRRNTSPTATPTLTPPTPTVIPPTNTPSPTTSIPQAVVTFVPTPSINIPAVPVQNSQLLIGNLCRVEGSLNLSGLFANRSCSECISGTWRWDNLGSARCTSNTNIPTQTAPPSVDTPFPTTSFPQTAPPFVNTEIPNTPIPTNTPLPTRSVVLTEDQRCMGAVPCLCLLNYLPERGPIRPFYIIPGQFCVYENFPSPTP